MGAVPNISHKREPTIILSELKETGPRSRMLQKRKMSSQASAKLKAPLRGRRPYLLLVVAKMMLEERTLGLNCGEA